MVHGGEITVKVSGIEKIAGKLVIGLFNQSRGFPETNHAFKGGYINVKTSEIEYVFSDILVGEYALAVFHDINNNDQFDKNILGMPKEGYGFSNNSTGFFGPPVFDDVKFNLESNYTVKIDIKY